MLKKIFLIVILGFSMFAPAFAEKIPVKITPTEIISTHHDEVQIGDWINFQTVNDVYKEDKLFIRKDTRVVGVVDFIHVNGWLADSADITLKEFRTFDVNDKKIEIYYPIKIKGSKFIETDARHYITYVADAFSWLAFFIRGPEIFIEPDTITYNIFIEK